MPAWIPVVVIVAAIGLYAVVRLFGGGKKPDPVAEAKAQAADIKAAADAQLAAELQEIDADIADLDRIKAINDDEARLAELAKYSNRRSR